jgi:hypothetical protein
LTSEVEVAGPGVKKQLKDTIYDLREATTPELPSRIGKRLQALATSCGQSEVP